MNISANKHIGKCLADLRKQAGLKQTDVSQALGKPQSFVSKIEIGERSLQVSELAAYAAALGVTPYEILEAISAK